MALRKLVQALRARQQPKEEVRNARVEAVLPNRRVQIQGHVIPLSGLAAPKAGDVIPVVFRGRTPILALQHRVNRAKAGWSRLAGDVLEELFLATDPATGKREVWFRNESQVTNLDLRKALPADPEYVKWGSRGDAFVVRTAGHQYHVFALERQDPDKSVGRVDATATLLRTDTPTTSGIQLATMSGVASWRRNRAYLQVDRITDALTDSGQPGGGEQSCLGSPLIYPSVATGGITSVPVTLQASLFTGADPIGVIEDVTLDDRRHLILVVSIDLTRLLASGGSFTVRLTMQHVLGSFASYTDADGNFHDSENVDDVFYQLGESVANTATPWPIEAVTDTTNIDVSGASSLPLSGRQLYVVDLTGGAVLWSSSGATPSITVQTVFDEFWCIVHHLHQTNYDEELEPVVTDVAVLKQFAVDIFGTPLDPCSFTNPNMTVEPALLEINRGGTIRMLSVVDEAAAPFLSDAAMLFTALGSPTDISFTQTFGGEFGDTFGLACLPITLRRRATNVLQLFSYRLTGHYVPRRMTTQNGVPTGSPLGMLYLTARKVRTSAATNPTRQELGVFAVDLATGQTFTIQDFQESFTPTSHPEYGWPTVELLTQNAHRLLWRYRKGLSTTIEEDSIRFSALVPLATQSVVTEQNTGYNPFTAAAPPEKAPVVALLTRNLTLLAPDFLYWAEERADGRGNVFVSGWDVATGALTLDAAAATTPPADGDLDRLGVLAELPTGVTPQRAKGIPTLYGQVDGNIPFVPGPSYRVVNDGRVFTARGRFIDEPETT